MKLEVGMYVRNTHGRIYKIEKIETTKVYYSCNPPELQWQDREFVYSKSGVECEDAILKASHTLLGNDKEPCLIEPGDYVNGSKVNFVYRPDGKQVFRIELDVVGLKGHMICETKDIKSIVTKEQFEAMAYKVGDSNE